MKKFLVTLFCIFAISSVSAQRNIFQHNHTFDINLGYNSLIYYYDNMPEFKEIVDNSICITTNGYDYKPAGGFSNYEIYTYAYDKRLFDFTEPITLYRNNLIRFVLSTQCIPLRSAKHRHAPPLRC